MSSELVAMAFNGDAPGLYRTPIMPSGQQYEYSGMPGRNLILAAPQDVKALQDLDFARVEAPKQEVERIAEVEKEVEQAETASADETKSSRRK